MEDDTTALQQQILDRMEAYANGHQEEIAAAQALSHLLAEEDDADFAHFLALMVAGGEEMDAVALLYDADILARVVRMDKTLYRAQLLPALRKANKAFNAYDYDQHLREVAKRLSPVAPRRAEKGSTDEESSTSNLAELWSIPIAKVIRHGEENVRWSLALEDGKEILLGTSKQLLDQRHVRAAIFDRTGKLIPRIAKQEEYKWDQILEGLYAIAVTVANPDSTRMAQAKELLGQYLRGQPGGFRQDFDENEWEDRAYSNHPFRRAGAIYLHARMWWNSCIRALAPDITYQDTLGLLRLVGATSERITLHKVAHTDRSYWRLPLSFLERIVDDV